MVSSAMISFRLENTEISFTPARNCSSPDWLTHVFTAPRICAAVSGETISMVWTIISMICCPAARSVRSGLEMALPRSISSAAP